MDLSYRSTSQKRITHSQSSSRGAVCGVSKESPDAAQRGYWFETAPARLLTMRR
jgi:hypothetical protein